MTNDPYSLLPAPLNPTGGGDEDFSGIYTPTQRSTFRARMLRTLKASPLRLYSWGTGNTPYRIIDVISSELESISYTIHSAIRRAISESTYRSWYHPQLFPERGRATLAQGAVTLSVPYALSSAETIPAGAIFGSRDGRTVRSLEEIAFPAGSRSITIPVVSEVVGSRGNFYPGEVTMFLTGKSSFVTTNSTAIYGGYDGESDEEMRIRFQDYVESRATASRLSLFSAVMNTRIQHPMNTAAQERATDAAVILPWRIPDGNNEMSYGYVVVDTGGASASQAFIAEANINLERVRAAGDVFLAIPVNPWIINLGARVSTTSTAISGSVIGALNTAWAKVVAEQCLIEDGRNRGFLSLYDVQIALAQAHPDVIGVQITSHSNDLQPPIGARVVAGELSLQILQGQIL